MMPRNQRGQRGIDTDQMIGDASGEVLEDEDILGFIVWATTGDVIVERDWLVEQFTQFERGERILPSPTWPSSAYKMAMSHLLKPDNRSKVLQGHEVEFRLKDGDTGNYKHLYADVTLSEGETGEEGGDIESIKCATFNYDKEAQRLVYIKHLDEEEEVNELRRSIARQACGLIGRAQSLDRKMKEAHDGQDLRSVFYKLRDEESHAVPLRHGGAVYFFPMAYRNTIEGLADVWSKLNQKKETGHEMEIANIPLIDNEGHREMVHRHAERILEQRVNDSVKAGLDRIMEDEDETAQEIAEDIVDDLDESLDMAEEYSALLDIRLSVKRHIQDWLSEVEGEQEAVVEEVLDSEEIGL